MKKGQLQMQETILVLVIFFVVLMIALVFFFRIQDSSISKMYDKFQEGRFHNLIMWMQDMPELRVSDLLHEEQCIDYYKALAFRDFSSNYRGELGWTEISLGIDGRKEVIYSNRPAKFSDLRRITSPVCLYDGRDQKHKVAKLEVVWYKR